MSKSETAIATLVPSSSGMQLEPTLVRPGSPIEHQLTESGFDMTTSAGQRAAAKAMVGICRDYAEGAALLAADAGSEQARHFTNCLRRVRRERASK